MDRQISGDRLKPWPDEFMAEYFTLLSSTRRLGNMAQVALEYGVNGHRDIPLLEVLLPRMANESRVLHAAILRMLRAKTGRWPNWVLYAVEEGIRLAPETVKAADSATRALVRQHWLTMQNALRYILQSTRHLEPLVLAGPMPEGADPQHLFTNVVEEVKEQ